jgi:PIN domain nuclease of toxin-antitoxin system
MTALLDTHFLLWLLLGSERLAAFPWLDRYRPWGLSPVTLLEVAFLGEAGRIEVDAPRLGERLAEDPRFLLDEVPTAALFRRAVELSFTRDPFDRLLAAHSAARQLPLITADRALLAHHRLVAPELQPSVAPPGSARG